MTKFEELKKYFSELNEDNILIKIDEKPFIDMSWLFTETLDREVIKRAISNFMSRNNQIYRRMSERINNNPEDIKGFLIMNYNGTITLQAQGADGWTKLNITDIPNRGNRIPNITIDELAREIENIFNTDRIEEIVQKVDLTPSQKDILTTMFKTERMGDSEFTLNGIKAALEQAWENLIEYYKYLVKEKQEVSIHRCYIKPTIETGVIRDTKGGVGGVDRFYDVIPFLKRKEKLESYKPQEIVQVGEINEENTITNNVYIVFVYRNCLQDIAQPQNGYLFFCEPLSGERNTKLFYLSEEEFESFSINKGEDRFAEITEKYLSMSIQEFYETEGTTLLKHTDAENYMDRMEFFLQGSKLKSIANKVTFLERLRELYKNSLIYLPYYKPRKIGDIGVGGEQGSVDRTAQEAISIEEKNKGTEE